MTSFLSAYLKFLPVVCLSLLCQDFKKHENKNNLPLFCVLEVIMFVSYLSFFQFSEIELVFLTCFDVMSLCNEICWLKEGCDKMMEYS